MNPKKKSRRCQGHGLDSGLDLAISCFIYSFEYSIVICVSTRLETVLIFSKYLKALALQQRLIGCLQTTFFAGSSVP